MKSIKCILNAVDSAMKEHGEDCLSSRYKKLKSNDDHYSFGLCYVASEAVKHLSQRILELDLKPCVGRVGELTHWWLEDTQTGERIDPTQKQFSDKSLLHKFYEAGRETGFLTKTPSKRSLPLIDHASKVLDF